MKSDEIGVLFRINYLCFAKVSYFRENIDKFEPLRFEPEFGFIPCEFWDSDYLKHIKSEKIIDYRYLQRITDIEVFKRFCNNLEIE